jgi:adenosylcobinamide-GDP ribazoletransferase
MKSFFAALKFLTILPVPAAWTGEERNLRMSVYLYPLAGLVMGTLVSLADYGFCSLVPLPVASVATVLVFFILSGGLHMDGLADTFDGLFSFSSRDKILSIMRDSRTGAMGTAAVAGVFLLKWTALFALESPLRWKVLVLVPFVGRCALLLHWLLLPYVRSEGGRASVFDKRHVLTAGIAAQVLLFLCSVFVLKLPGFFTALAVTCLTFIFSMYTYFKIKGMTGDTLGAVCELAECAALVACSGLL